MAQFKTKVLIPHMFDCRAVQYVKDGTWSTPWYLPHEPHDRDRRDSLGRYHKHGYCDWMRLHCNSLDCDAVLLVRTEEFAAHPDFVELGQ